MSSNWSKFSEEIIETISTLSKQELETITDDVDIAVKEQNYAGRERVIITKARVGQSLFRNSVLSSYNFKCCISGLSVPKLLIASHIVPWKDDAENRLHPSNGLALSMIHDRAFDIGIITITDDYKIKVSQKYHSKDDDFFNSSLQRYNGENLILPNKFSPKPEFLEFHRDTIFESRTS